MTVTFELPEEICQILEERAAREGRDAADLVAEYVAAHSVGRNFAGRGGVDVRAAAVEQYIGSYSGGPRSSDNRLIDADLARELGNK